jgi:HAD superfamily phosphoserine phosphatase-like hydrolase
MKYKFIFDLDGTITKQETLPLIAKHFGIEEEILKLTKETIRGNIPFIESFIRRIKILGRFSVLEIAELLAEVELFDEILKFIEENMDDCIIATGNTQEWVGKLVRRIGCEYYASEALVEDDKIAKLTHILKKEEIVKKYQDEGYSVVMIGDGNNDMEAMREADISVACGLIHYPANSIMTIADYCVFEPAALYRLLDQIVDPKEGTSLVLSCAGIGSRLGLDKTKALIEIENKKLIHHQLEAFKAVEDIRIVIGYQANSVIEAALQVRGDVVFVFNHDYFYTKTGTSFYLGARHGKRYAVAWDGDLIVNPADIDRCLDFDGEYVGCSQKVTDDAVFVKVNEKDEVVFFSRENGDYAWSGPAKLKKENIPYVSTNVYNQIEPLLPLPMLKIEAQDIDTYDDYLQAIELMGSWKND